MDPVSQSVLLQVMQIALIALAFGLAFRATLDQALPEHTLGLGGNVWTGPIRGFDIIAAGLLLALFYFSLTGTSPPPQAVDAEQAEKSLNAIGILQASLSMLILAGFIVMIIMMRGTSIIEFFGLDRLTPKGTIIWSIAGCIVAYFAAILVGYFWLQKFVNPVMGEPQVQEMITFFKETATSTDRLAVIISACLIAPVAEEIIFRGYIYPVLKRFTEPILAAILVSVIFALVHQNLAALVPLCAMSLILILAYETTASLWVPIGIHSLFNGANLLLTQMTPQ